MIIGFQVNQIESKSFAGAESARQHKSININFDINIRNPLLVEQNTPFGKKQVIKLEYAMSINYLNPNIGYIRFEGSTDYYQEGDLEAMHKEWTGGSAPTNVQNEIANTMVSNLAPLALTMSKTLGLPPAVPLPAINFKGKQEEKKPDEPTYYHG
ncbi:MAG: hypothetical protein K0A89_04080 [ANME-2 cluster archaeon]|nr:hypothetical protein [ANME-2 cluster archaeon]